MTKKAIRISIDGSNSAVNESQEEIMKTVSSFPSDLGRSGASIRISSYEPENPEALKMELGKVTRWLAGDESKDGNPVSDGNSEAVEDEKFTSQLRKNLLPAMKSLAEEVMWGPGGKAGRKAREDARNAAQATGQASSS